MVIKDIFTKDLFRPINGVVKADQKDDAIVWQELDEYVVTKELDKHLRTFFGVYLNALDNASDPTISGKIGVWISGFFGSGKSHFIKILSYLLENRLATNPDGGEKKTATAFFENKITDPLLWADIKRATNTNTDVILFNIDSKADNKDNGALLSSFWRVFNELQGFSGDDPYIAEMERYLTEKSKYEEFCQHFTDACGEDWMEARDAYHFRRDELIKALSKTLGQSQKSAEEWFEKAGDSFNLTIEGFAKRVKKYLDAGKSDQRLVFLVDEVGQFIGTDTHLMLNLQTISEDLGRICQGRAWVVVTSQEDIDAVLGEVKASEANDFSKIQGRFSTRLALSSSNTDEVIQKRLLEKTPEAQAELEILFNEKSDILANQLSFTQDGATLPQYKGAESFVISYPFAPHHFTLAQKIFESIRKVGATGKHLAMGERSMLDAFQTAAKSVSKRKVGALVPLHEFYPAIESFLDTAVKRTIDQAGENAGLEEPFDIHLLRTLFLIRYVEIIKPNVDNLVTLFIDQVDADRLSLKRKVQEGLQRLEKQTLISRNGDLYFFLTNEERDVSREIKSLDVPAAEETKLVADILFEDILTGQPKHRYKPNKCDYTYNRMLDGHPYGSKLDQELSVEIVSPLHDEYGAFNESKCVMYSSEHTGRLVVKILGTDSEFGREVRTYWQTDKYIGMKSDASTTQTLKRILRDRQAENRERKQRIASMLEDLMVDAEAYAMGQKLDLNASTARARRDEALDYLVQNLYNKFAYLKKLQDDPQSEVKHTLLASDADGALWDLNQNLVNPDALREMRDRIKLQVSQNHPVIVSDLVEYFTKRPYGWPDWEIILLIARLFMAKELNIIKDGAAIEPKKAVEPMLKRSAWKTLKLIQRRTPTKEEIAKAQKLGKELFGKPGADAADELYEELRNELIKWQKDLSAWLQLAQTGEYPGRKVIEGCLKVLNGVVAIKDTFEFITAFNKARDDLRNAGEDIYDLTEFYKNQKPTWEKLRSAIQEFKPNRAVLVEDSDAKPALERLEDIFHNPEPYGMLKEVEVLISKVSTTNSTLIQKKRTEADKFIASKIETVKAELQSMKASSDFSNKVLYPLQCIRKDIEAETSIPNISYKLEGFDDKLRDSLETIEEKKDESSHTPKKPTQTIKPASLAPKLYLETEQDVDEYIDRLKEEMQKALKRNAKIRLV